MLSNELVMLRNLWKKAFAEGGLDVPFKSRGGAQRCRLQLYNAVALVKKGKDMEDMELFHAADTLEITWADEEHTIIRFRRKADNDMTQGVLAALGAQSVSDFVDPKVKESGERLMRELGLLGQETAPRGEEPAAPPAEHQHNPFYGKRED